MALIPTFEPGKRLFDGLDFQRMVSLLLATNPGLTALAGGGQTGAPVLNYGWNEVSTSGAGGTDSVQMPPASPGVWVGLINSTANTIDVYASIASVNGVALTDTITPNNTITPTATGSAVSFATTKIAIFVCFKIGAWKEFLTA